MKLETFEDLIAHQVKDLYSAEKQFAAAQPAMAEIATDPDLRDALETHVETTHLQIERLKTIAGELGVATGGVTCAAAKGLVEEGMELLETDGDPAVLDAALIAAAQRIEHYEIAGYGTLRALARRLGRTKAVRLIDETLAEERGADVLLTELAESSVNREAAS
ncbi:ferritin-like domain-containing protein [soil metagenome]